VITKSGPKQKISSFYRCMVDHMFLLDTFSMSVLKMKVLCLSSMQALVTFNKINVDVVNFKSRQPKFPRSNNNFEQW